LTFSRKVRKESAGTPVLRNGIPTSTFMNSVVVKVVLVAYPILPATNCFNPMLQVRPFRETHASLAYAQIIAPLWFRKVRKILPSVTGLTTRYAFGADLKAIRSSQQNFAKAAALERLRMEDWIYE